MRSCISLPYVSCSHQPRTKAVHAQCEVAMSDGTPLVLTYSHNIVEHLGLKLYQNKPTNVIAELISNSWDADATEARVNIATESDPRWIAVHDNGHGMTR